MVGVGKESKLYDFICYYRYVTRPSLAAVFFLCLFTVFSMSFFGVDFVVSGLQLKVIELQWLQTEISVCILTKLLKATYHYRDGIFFKSYSESFILTVTPTYSK